jgi:paraquat-inducible protein B
MRSHAQRILEESQAQRAQTEAEFEIQLATRKEQTERQEAERLAAAQSATQKLVFEAEQRASTAEQRAAKANAQADQAHRDADQYARQLVGNAEKNADQIAGQAKTQAGQLLAEVNADAERRRAATRCEVDDLTRQKDSIASHLAQVRQLLPGMNAVQAAQTKPAITGDSDR